MADALLLESGDRLLLEDGSGVLNLEPVLVPPTFISNKRDETGFNSTASPRAIINLNGLNGDVVVAGIADFDVSSGSTENPTFATTPVAETWTEQTASGGISNADVWVQTATTQLTADRTGFAVNITHASQTATWGSFATIWRGSTGIGASARSSGAGTSQPALTITTTKANSAILYLIANWTDDLNAARTHRVPSGGTTPVEIDHYNSASDGSALWAYVANAGEAGPKVVGLTAPTGDYQIVAVEIFGAESTTTSVSKTYNNTWNVAANSTTPVSKTYAQSWNVNSAISKTYSQTWNTRSVVAAKTYAQTWNTKTVVSKTYAGAWNVRGSVAPKSYANAWSVYSVLSTSYANTWNINTSIGKMYSVDWNLFAQAVKSYTDTWNVAADSVAEYYTITDATGLTPPTAATSDGAAVNLGTEFYVTSTAWATKIRWWQPTTNSPSTTSRTVGIYRVDSDSTGTLVAGPFTSTPIGSGWQNAVLPVPLELITNQRYRVVVLHPNGQYASTSNVFVGADYIDGPLRVPMTPNAVGLDNGSFNYGTSLSFTTGSFNNSYYWSDVEVTDTNPSGLSKVTKTSASTWTVDSDKLYSFWPSDRAGWNSTPGTVYSDPNTPGGSWGLIFAVSGSCQIGGVRWYAPVAKSGAHLYLADGDSGVVYHDQDNYEISVGWNEIVFDTPYVASPGITYKILLWQPGNQDYSYTDDNRWTTGDNRAVGNIYSMVDGPSDFHYGQAEPTTTVPSGASGVARWPAMDVIEVLPVEEELDTSFGATVALENAKTGSPSSGWMITGAGDIGNIGYTGKYHYDKATDTTVDFHCHGPGTKIDIYRLGYYQGHGARQVATLTNTATTQGNASTIANSNGGIEFNWSTTATWTIPSDALSGFFFAVYRNPDETNASWIPFILADRDRTASMAYKTSDFTWYGAYNYCGDLGSILTGKSVYGSGGPLGNIATRHFVGSYRRPCVTREGVPQTYWMNSESSTIMFLEEQGIDVKYTSCIGLDQTTTGLTNINLLLSSGHDEYWSDGMTDNVQALRDTEGVNLIFMSGNENFWRVFWDHTNKRMTCRKDTMSGPDTHVAGVPFIDNANWTGTWRDTRWPLRRPENETTGTYFDMNGVMDKTLVVDAATYGSHTVWRNTSVATGTNLSLPRVVGFEADSYMPTQPVGSYSLLAAQVFNIDGSKADANGENYNLAGNLNYGIVAQRFNNSVVVGFGTCQWQWALIGTHDRTATTPNVNARQMTLNLLTDLGAPPTTTTAGLVTPTPQSLDNYGEIYVPDHFPLAEYGFVDNLQDTSGNNRHGTLSLGTAPSYVAGPLPDTKAIQFTATNQQISLGRTGLEPAADGITYMAWVYLVHNPGGADHTAGLYKVRGDGSTRAGFYFEVQNQLWQVYRWKDDLDFASNRATLPQGEWHHVAFVDGDYTAADEDAIAFYLDGVRISGSARVGQRSPGASAVWENYPWVIGALSNFAGFNFVQSGVGSRVSHVRLFQGKLDATEINYWMDTPILAGGAPTTPVTKSASTGWNVNAFVNKTQASTWNVASTVNKTSASTWNVNQTVNDTNSVTWAVRTTVSKSYAPVWAVRSVTAKTYAQTWNARSTVAKSYSQLWNTAGALTTVSKTSSSNWNVQATVAPATNTNVWNVREVANKAAANSWTVREALSKASSSTWSVRSLATTSKAGTWNVLARIPAKSYANSWTARVFVTDTNAVSWNVRALVSKNYQNLWDTEATGSVSSTYPINWNVRTRTTTSYSQNWNVRTSLVTSKASTWNIRALAAKSYLQAWSVRALTTKTSALTWDAYVAILKATNINWAVRSSVGSIVDFSWRVRSLATTEIPISWSVLELVTDQLPINWDILVLIGKSADNQWSINRQIIRGYTNNWNVGENSRWYVMTSNGPVLYRMVGVWDGTQVVAI